MVSSNHIFACELSPATMSGMRYLVMYLKAALWAGVALQASITKPWTSVSQTSFYFLEAACTVINRRAGVHLKTRRNTNRQSQHGCDEQLQSCESSEFALKTIGGFEWNLVGTCKMVMDVQSFLYEWSWRWRDSIGILLELIDLRQSLKVEPQAYFFFI